MSQESAPGHESITFEEGYEELKNIVARLNDEDISVHEMFEGFRRGKGLEKALRGYLTEREGELTEIEQGNNLPEFSIVAPSAHKPAESDPDVSFEDVDLLKAHRSTGASTEVADAEIPF
ncbi:MAG TPA: exodeoxyribonuclease VII small subunit [Solirubrobacteraceae bacterium]